MSDLPNGWCWTTVGRVTSRIETTDPKHQPTKSFTYVNIGSIDNSTHTIVDPKTLLGAEAPSRARQALRVGDTVFSTVRTYLRNIGYIDSSLDGAIGSTGFSVLRPAHRVNSRYLYYYSLTNRFVDGLSAQMRGTSYPAVVDSQVREMDFPLAPTAEQGRIVAAIEEQLSRLDAGVAALGRVRQNLKGMRAAVLHAAVTGRLAVQDASEGTGADLLAAIKLDGRRNGRAFPSADYTAAAGTRLLRPGNLYASGRVGWTAANTRCLPEHYASEFPSYLVGPNEIVINLTAQSLKDEFLGRVCMTGPRDESVLLNQRIARLTPVGLNLRFVFYVLKSPLFRRFVDQLNTGSLIQHMFTSQLDQFILPIPPRGEQDRIVERIEGCLASLDHLDDVVVRIGKLVPVLRSAILTAAFSGRLASQDPTDESASALLERIASERASYNGHRPGRSARKPRLLREAGTA